MSIPEELEHREKRLMAIRATKQKIEARAAKLYAEEKEAYEHKLAEREKQATSNLVSSHNSKDA